MPTALPTNLMMPSKIMPPHMMALPKTGAHDPLSASSLSASSLSELAGLARWQQATPINQGQTPLSEATLSESTAQNGIPYRNITKRIWTVMQEGMRRGFEFRVLGDITDRTFVANRNGKGFVYRIYPGHFSFRCQYDDYDAEQAKAHKLALMNADGLSVPVAYGLFQTFADIPLEQLSFPLVAKPNNGSLSENVFPHLENVAQLKAAANIITNSQQPIQVESHISGKDYRVLILNHHYAGCVERRPASVIGDGKHSIAQLFQQRNTEPGRADRDEAHTTIHYLVFDEVTHHLLETAGYTPDTVLAKGERFYLQNKITASTGSDYIDCTDQLHPSIIKSCVDFSHRFTTLTLGFDIITTDISRPLSETNGAFNEYNFLPYVDLHENCNIGTKRPVCQRIWDYVEANHTALITPAFESF